VVGAGCQRWRGREYTGNFEWFFYPKAVGRFTVFRTNIPVILIGLLVISTDLVFDLAKFEI
jgi:hypothetical protein